MCGITGVIGTYLNNQNLEKQLHELMQNRGPDDQGHLELEFQNQNKIKFFFSRLSIIDLKERSNQPYTKYNKTIIFNGEIYNYLELKESLSSLYSFETSSDTEVLLTAYHHYGINFLDKLEGMWAFSIFDKEKNILIISRDRFGEKPLYYYKNDNLFIYGSEVNYIKKLLNKNAQVNNKKVQNLLCFGYRTMFNDDDTFIDEIKTFPKSTVWILDQNLEIVDNFEYWNLNYSDSFNEEYEVAVEEIEQQITKSIELRLRSDVKVGISLSGGIDSSLILSIAQEKFNKNIDTFSIVDKDSRYNETKNINEIRNKLCLNNYFDIEISEENFLSNLTTLVQYHCSPVLTISSYINSFIAKEAKNNGNKVILSGIGADELFLGYYYHYLYWLNDKFINNDNFQSYFEEWEQCMGAFVENPLIKDVKTFNKDSTNRDHLFNDERLFKSLLINKAITNPYVENTYNENLLRNRMLNDLFKDVVPVVLHQEDLNYMFSSVENRCPFLDRNLAEKANTLPNKFLIRNGFTKPILRDVNKKYLPAEVVDDLQKRGFNASIETLFDVSNKNNIDFCLSESKIFEIIDRKKIEEFLTQSFHSNSLSKFLFIFLSTKIFMDYIND